MFTGHFQVSKCVCIYLSVPPKIHFLKLNVNTSEETFRTPSLSFFVFSSCHTWCNWSIMIFNSEFYDITVLFKCHISVVLQFEHQTHSEAFFKPRAELCPRDADSAGLGWGPKTCTSSKFSGDADVAGPGSALRIKATPWRLKKNLHGCSPICLQNHLCLIVLNFQWL